jgi:hypothetical protein
MAQVSMDNLSTRELEAVQVRREYEATIAQIKSTITHAEPRRVKLAQAWYDARYRIQKLQAEQTAANEKDDQVLVDRFFAAPTEPAGVIAQRDADDRAAQATTPEQALNLLARAALSKDLTLAKATLLVAILRNEPGFSTVVDNFKSRWPALANDVDGIVASPLIGAANPTGRFNAHALANLMASASAFSIPPKPNEIRALSDSDVERLLQEAQAGL